MLVSDLDPYFEAKGTASRRRIHLYNEAEVATDTRKAIKIWLDVRYSTFNIQILNVEYRISN